MLNLTENIAFRFFFALFLTWTTISITRAQSSGQELISDVDKLTTRWDEEAKKLESHDGLKDYCGVKFYRDNVLELLTTIHHYDSLLFAVVSEKYRTSQDKVAKETLDEIQSLESSYNTRSFIQFLRAECMAYNDAERNKSAGTFDEEVKELEKELKKYVEEITRQIDLIDKHAHHLRDL